TLAVATTLGTLGTFTRAATGNQGLLFFHFGQSQRLTVGCLAQQGSSQGTRAATDIGNQLVEQLAMAGFGIGNQRREAVGQFFDACIKYLLTIGQACLGDLLVGSALNDPQHAALARRDQQQRAAFTTGT